MVGKMREREGMKGKRREERERERYNIFSKNTHFDFDFWGGRAGCFGNR
jgi:hypothetical protein